MLRRPEPQAALVEAASEADRLVLLGDTLELRHGPLAEVLAVAEPVLRRAGSGPGTGRRGGHRGRQPRPPPAPALAGAARRGRRHRSRSGSRPTVDWREGEPLAELGRLAGAGAGQGRVRRRLAPGRRVRDSRPLRRSPQHGPDHGAARRRVDGAGDARARGRAAPGRGLRGHALADVRLDRHRGPDRGRPRAGRRQPPGAGLARPPAIGRPESCEPPVSRPPSQAWSRC